MQLMAETLIDTVGACFGALMWLTIICGGSISVLQ
jgi:hypothetical protein